MIRSPRAIVLLATALLAAWVPLSFAADSPDVAYLQEHILVDNDPAAAGFFLADNASQQALKASDPALYQQIFLRAAELKDLKGVLDGATEVHSIRISLLNRTVCSFCLDPVAFPAWAKKHLSYLDPSKFSDINAALWSWDSLSITQKAWIGKQKKEKAWPKLDFIARHALMRRWALGERDALLKLNPKDAAAVDGLSARARLVQEVLGSHEMTEVWNLIEQATQASSSLAEARAKIGNSADPRQKALLAEAINAASPEARLAALSRLFENAGVKSRALDEAAPPKPDQRFDAASREVVGSMLKTALLKETAGTFAGRDLQEFYGDRGVPLVVKFENTAMRALGWYDHGTDVLNFNERYVEQYVKSRGLSVEDLKRDPALLGDLARTLVGTFVHEAQHHRQDVWARDNKVPLLYHQGDEVEAFQTQAMFLMEKMDRDPKFRAFADAEGEHSKVLKTGLGRAQHMRDEGPDYFDWTVPNAHYPEILSNEGNAWCEILWHNNVAKTVEGELARRRSLPAASRAKLEAAPPLKEDYQSNALFLKDLRLAGSGSLTALAAKARQDTERSIEFYTKLRARQEAVRRITEQRYDMLKSGSKRTETAGPPSPGLGADKEGQ